MKTVKSALGPLPPSDGQISVEREGTIVWFGIACGDEYGAMALYDKSIAELANGTFMLAIVTDKNDSDAR